MHQTMTHADDPLPGNIGMCCSRLIADPGRRLADDFNGPRQCEGQHLVLVEVAPASPLGKADCCLNRFDHMPNAHEVIALHIAPPLCAPPHRGSNG